MRMTTGRVVQGRIEVPDEAWAEGTEVTILIPEEAETFTLNHEAEAALLAAIEDVDRGEFFTEAEMLHALRK
ncbi:MAG: hypothetical protein ABJC13_15165 [Acidobacteriota bacterium]